MAFSATPDLQSPGRNADVCRRLVAIQKIGILGGYKCRCSHVGKPLCGLVKHGANFRMVSYKLNDS